MPCASRAASLRAFRILPGTTVRLSDLFEDLRVNDRVLGPSPQPGQRIMVQAPQLAAIARDYNVDWRPLSGAELTILQRDARPFTQEAAIALLRPLLTGAGAAADAAVTLADYRPAMLPREATPAAELSDMSYDAASGKFTATLTLTVRDMPPFRHTPVGPGHGNGRCGWN